MNDTTQTPDPADQLREHQLNATAALLAPYIFQNMAGLRTLLEGFKASIMAEVKTMIEQQETSTLAPGQLGQAIGDWLENNFDPAEAINDWLEDNLEDKLSEKDVVTTDTLEDSVREYLENNLEDEIRDCLRNKVSLSVEVC
jgi:hypothetical protein